MKIILLFVLLLVSTKISSQEVFAAQGKSHKNTASSIDFTIGEVVISTFSTPANTLTQGFHQTNLTVLGLDDYNSEYIINIYPNPTSDVLKIDISDHRDLKYILYDIHGREIQKSNISLHLTDIDMEILNQGLYFLTILSENNIKIKTYKIIKN